ncbi:MAG TPA: hypothetical protein VFD43_00460 [Planctomycetota bacterium]|nr:hypothetical protein [Planctomycetota bacterium]
MPSRRILPLLLPALLLLTAACSSTQERWAEAHARGVSYPVLYNLVLSTIDAEGFTVRKREPQKGRIESDWVYGTSQRLVRGPSRRKVFAVIDPSEEGGFRVAVRVAEEVIRKGGLMATHVRASEDWEEYDDNFDDAEYLMAKIAALIQAGQEP